MFEIPAEPLLGNDSQQFFSFEETAAEIGCGVGDLKRAMEAMRHRVVAPVSKEDRSTFTDGKATIAGPPLTAFLAISLEDYRRLAMANGSTLTLAPPDGFPGVVRRDQLQKAFGVTGVALQEQIDRGHIAEIRMDCLTQVGHDFAVNQIGVRLRDETPPAGLDAIGIAAWRDGRRHAKFNAEEASAATPSKAPSRRALRRAHDAAAAASMEP
jgi:hypothetical protein